MDHISPTLRKYLPKDVLDTIAGTYPRLELTVDLRGYDHTEAVSTRDLRTPSELQGLPRSELIKTGCQKLEPKGMMAPLDGETLYWLTRAKAVDSYDYGRLGTEDDRGLRWFRMTNRVRHAKDQLLKLGVETVRITKIPYDPLHSGTVPTDQLHSWYHHSGHYKSQTTGMRHEFSAVTLGLDSPNRHQGQETSERNPLFMSVEQAISILQNPDRHVDLAGDEFSTSQEVQKLSREDQVIFGFNQGFMLFPASENSTNSSKWQFHVTWKDQQQSPLRGEFAQWSSGAIPLTGLDSKLRTRLLAAQGQQAITTDAKSASRSDERRVKRHWWKKR